MRSRLFILLLLAAGCSDSGGHAGSNPMNGYPCTKTTVDSQGKVQITTGIYIGWVCV